MAQIAYSGVPSAAPTEPGGDYQQIQPTDAAAGANVAQATEQLGDTLQSHVVAFQGMQNEATAKDADIAFAQSLDDIQFNPQSGYYNLKGKAAVDAYPEMHKKVMDLYQTQRAALGNPDTQKMFDAVATRRAIFAQGDMSRHAATENQSWIKQAGVGRVGQAINESALDPLNDAKFTRSIGTINDEVEQLGHLEGAPPEKIKFDQQHYTSEAWTARIKSVMATDPIAAHQMLEHADLDAPHRAALTDEIEPKFNRAAGRSAGQLAIARVGTDALTGIQAAPVTPAKISHAIFAQESGNNPNAPTSVTGAQGLAQIEPGTFKQYALPGEQIGNPDDNKVVGQRIIDDLSKRYNGDPARVAVGYFSGPGNVAPAGAPTPWLEDKKDPNGKSVSAYVQDVTGKLGVSSPTMAKAKAYTDVLSMNLPPDQEREALAYISQQAQAAEVAAMETERAKKEEQDGAANGYIGQALKGQANAQTINQIADDPRLSWEVKERLGDKIQEHLKDTTEGVQKAFGPGFWKAYQAILAPAGTPGRLGDINAVLKMAGPQPITPDFNTQSAPGMTKPGNLDPWNRPSIRNEDGSYSTTSSISIGVDGGEVVIPTVVGGKRLSNEDAIQHYKTTGENLGTFSTPQAADDYAQKLHEAQSSIYDATGQRLTKPGDITLPGVNALAQYMRENNNPDKFATNKSIEGVLTYAKHQLSFEADYGDYKVRDPHGEDAFNIGFIPAFMDYAKDKGIAELSDRKQVDAMIAQFKRTPAQELADRMASGAIEPATGMGSQIKPVTLIGSDEEQRATVEALQPGTYFTAGGKTWRKRAPSAQQAQH